MTKQQFLIAGALLLAPVASAIAAGQTTLSFQQGLNGYSGSQDAHIRSNETSSGDSRGLNYGELSYLSVDGDDGSPGAKPNQGLIRFDQLFGNAAGQIKAGDTIVSATLTLNVFDVGSGFSVHQMLRDWAEANVTWNSVGNGVQTNGVEAATAALASFGANNSSGNIGLGPLLIDVSGSLQAMQAGQVPAFGWLLQPFAAGTNGVDFRSSEYATLDMRPLLTVAVVSSVPEPQTWALLAGGLLAVAGLKKRRS